MKSGFSLVKSLVWLTQFGFSVVSPLIICILGTIWLSNRFGMGKWIIVVGIFAGLGGAVSGLMNSLKAMERVSKTDDKKDMDSVYFNDHK